MRRLLTLIGALLGLAAASAPVKADILTFTAVLSGSAESPPNSSPGIGFAIVTLNQATHFLRVEASFSGLLGNTTASHIHAATALPGVGTAGVATQVPTFSAFPLGVTSGSFAQEFDTSLASSFNPAFITANGGTVASAESALFSAIIGGKAYLNIHTTNTPGGEIRGFLVPAPPAVLLAGVGVVLAGGVRRFRRRRATV